MAARVLMVVSNGFTHDPRVAAEAASLHRAGCEVVVLAWDRRATLPQEETRDGVRVLRVRTTIGMRLRPYDLFRLRPFWRLVARRALDLHREAPFDAIHCHDLDTLPAGVRWKEWTGRPLVYDAHEYFPEMIAELSRARAWSRRFAGLEQRLARRADLILGAAPPHQEYFARMTNVPVAIVMNTRPLAYDSFEPPRNARMKVVYIGGLQQFRLLVPFAELAVEDGSFEADIGGWGPVAGAIQTLADASKGNLRYLGVVPGQDVIPLTHASDVVYSLLDPSKRVFRDAAPNKLFEAVVAGRPILVTKGTWAAREVEAADCGVSLEYTKEALHEALKDLQRDSGRRERMGRNAFRLAQEKYNWSRDEAVLLSAYRRLGLAV